MKQEEKVLDGLQNEVKEQDEVKVDPNEVKDPEEIKQDPDPTDKDKVDEKDKEEKPNRNEILRELSKELGVNLFDVEGLKELKNLKDDHASQIETIKKELDEIKSRELKAQQEADNARLETLRMKYNIDPDKFKDFLVLTEARVTDEKSVEQAFTETLEQYGDTFISKKPREQIQLGIQIDGANPVKEEVESFDQAVLEAYLRNRK